MKLRTIGSTQTGADMKQRQSQTHTNIDRQTQTDKDSKQTQTDSDRHRQRRTQTEFEHGIQKVWSSIFEVISDVFHKMLNISAY